MKILISLLLALAAFTVNAQNYPAPQEGSWVARDFRFHTGEVLPELSSTTRPSARRPASRCWSCTAPPARARAC